MQLNEATILGGFNSPRLKGEGSLKEGEMRLLEIEKKAKGLGIKDTWKYSKKDLIRTIQRGEGYNACFATRRTCDQLNCCWKSDCVR